MLLPAGGTITAETGIKRPQPPSCVLLEKKPKKRRWVDRKSPPRKWSAEEDKLLTDAVNRFDGRNWKQIAEFVPNRNHTQCLQRWAKVLAPDLRKGQWSAEEDTGLVALVAEMARSEEGSVRNWAEVADRITGRTTKQCRERWFNHLDPSIKRGNYTAEEDKLIMEQQAMIGNRWSVISGMLPGRTEDAVKIRWKTLTRPASSANRSAKKRKPKTNSTNSSVSSKAQKENRKPLLRKKMPEQKEVDRFVRKGCSKNLSELFAASEVPSAMVDFEGEIFSDHLNKQPSLSELCLLDFDLPLQMDKTSPSPITTMVTTLLVSTDDDLVSTDEQSTDEDEEHYCDRVFLRQVLCC